MSCNWYSPADSVATFHEHRQSSMPYDDLVQHDHHDEWMRFLQAESRSMVSSTSYPIQTYPTPQLSRAAAIAAVALQAQARSRNPSQNQPLSTWSNPSSEKLSKPAENWPSRPSPRLSSQRSYSISSSTSSASSWSSSSSSSVSESDTEPDSDVNYHSSITGPRNKILPPPTLSPILVPATTAAFLSVSPSQRSRSTTCSMSACSDDSGSVSSFCDTDTDDDYFSDAWPKMNKILLKGDSASSSPDNNASLPLSELPPPPSLLMSMQHHRDDAMSPATSRKYLALSASIWGPGWHQVEPLPPSFIKTLEQSELEAQAQAQALAQEKAAQVPLNPKAKARKAKQQAKAAAAALVASAASESDAATMTAAEASTGADSSSTVVASTNPAGSCMTTLCSSRLPRSLQFVD
ncbi:hypothetical protein BGZ72_001148 [Mortierella alpina]|nr:hypothetical protein BGZ72_001148 [Mortierella alpina]